jgi:hypothetical protein
MKPEDHETRRIVVLGAARNLMRAAESRCATLPERAPERQFFLGIEAAAREVVHPEIQVSRSEQWLAYETPEFREGYTRTSTMIAMAETSLQAPRSFQLLEPSSTT